MNAHTPILRSNDHSNTTGRNLELLLSKEDICSLNPINLYTYTDSRTGNQSWLASSNIIELCSLGVMDDVRNDHYPLNVYNWCLFQKTHYKRPPRWKIKGVDWGMWGSEIPDSTLESSNSVIELNDDFQMRMEYASSLVLRKTSLTPPSGRKTPW